ncbi:hypothetical protein KFE25_013994 [Diacronema lutheri]|uniref:Uncharacterized protein n=1 Tax=Diacronema lutheri TaxID=2081491 RepID=A0A8J6C9V2_DIALT|nr:hypothetical protein KFE25_013994 [Diacronema lutheri]
MGEKWREGVSWLLAACALALFPILGGLSQSGAFFLPLRAGTQLRSEGQLPGVPALADGAVFAARAAHAHSAAAPRSKLSGAAGGTDAPAAASLQPPPLRAPPTARPELPTDCDLAWRPGLAAHVPRGDEMRAWLSAEPGSAPLARLEGVLEKLLRGEEVTVYFLGDSVTRGSGAHHGCLTCNASAPPTLHPWLNASSARGPQASGGACASFDAAASRGGNPHTACVPPVRRERASACRVRTGARASNTSSAAARSAELTAGAAQCYPRNSWRCLLVQWLEHAFPGQVRVHISSKPLLFMAACFGRALGGVDLILHEQAVNGGGRMLCLQERILHAALARRKQLAVLMLLWLPKTYHPTRASAVLRGAQDGLARLASHYSVPTLAMTRAFAARCAPGEAWCYDKAHGTADSARGAAGSLHADLNHPNDGGHAFLAAHLLALLERTAARTRARVVSERGGGDDGGYGGAPRASAPRALEPPPLPAPLYPVNLGLGAHSRDDGGLCVDVGEMATSAVRNSGWTVRVEMAASKVARLPALQADAAGAEIEWQLDVRGADWLIVTYMQSYAGFGAVRLSCGPGCGCRPNAAPESNIALINATDPAARFSEPQWALLDLSRHSAECRVRATSVSPLKFKLMLLSLIRVRPPGVADTDADSVASASEAERKRRGDALNCFGAGKGRAINGRVRTTGPWAALSAAS